MGKQVAEPLHGRASQDPWPIDSLPSRTRGTYEWCYGARMVVDPPDLSAATRWLAQASPETRKQLGQWVTPWWACVQILDRLAPELPPRPTVLDPACGDGRWLLAAARRLKEPRLIGVDVDPNAIAAARATLERHGVSAELVCADALAPGALPSCDVVVGNPPFVRPQHLPREQAQDLWARYRTATDKSDLFCCFVERALQCAPWVALVIGRVFLSLSSFAALRQHLLEAGVDGVFSLPDDTFDATVSTAVVVSGPSDRRQAGHLGPDGFHLSGTLYAGTTWSLDGPPPTLHGTPLGELVSIHMGVVCGDYKRYVRQHREITEDRPTCRGRDVRRWTIQDPGLFLRYLPREMLDRKPYVAPKHAGLFDVPEKIVVAGTTGRRLVAAMDPTRKFPLDSCYVIHPKGATDLFAVLGTLLSESAESWYGARFPAPRVKGVELAQIPMPVTGWSQISEAARAQDDQAVHAAVRAAYQESAPA